MSQKVLSARVQDHFQSLPDPRRRKVIYPLISPDYSWPVSVPALLDGGGRRFVDSFR